MKNLDLAYLAGIVDGEGYISPHYCVSRKGLVRYQLEFGVNMIDKPPLELLQKYFGGKIRIKKQRGNRQAIFSWQLSGFNARGALLILLPYLLIKHAQAKIALRMLDSHERCRHYSPLERFLHEADALAIKELNQK